MGACDTWNVEISILADENEIFSLLAEFHFNNLIVIMILLIKKLSLLIILRLMKKLRPILKLLSLKLMIESEFLSISIYLVKLTLKIG